MELNSKQRAYLKGLASVLEPVLQIGKGSLTPEVTESVAEAFNNRELVKITVLKNCFDNPKELASVLAERTHSTVVQVIGKKIVLYKESKSKKKIHGMEDFAINQMIFSHELGHIICGSWEEDADKKKIELP